VSGCSRSPLDAALPGRERRDRGRHAGICCHLSRDRIKSILFLGWFFRVTFIPAALLIGVWFLLQLLNAGTVVNEQEGTGIAYAAHIGGMLFGATFGRFFEGPRQIFG
jgi:membrane associated rhomboid family serine protease